MLDFESKCSSLYNTLEFFILTREIEGVNFFLGIGVCTYILYIYINNLMCKNELLMLSYSFSSWLFSDLMLLRIFKNN